VREAVRAGSATPETGRAEAERAKAVEAKARGKRQVYLKVAGL
jgi:hypothetical protein